MQFKNILSIIVGCALSFSAGTSYAEGMEDFLEYYDTDDYGNAVYFGLGSESENSYDFIFVDGSKTEGTFSSASIATIHNTKQAGYAVIPANSFEQMGQNSQFSMTYFVDCEQDRVKDEMGDTMRLSNMSAFHRTSAAMACSVLDMN